MTTDPLGLTEQQREAGQDQLSIDDLKTLGEKFMAQMKANLERFDALPDGTIVYCLTPGCGGHPVETLR